MIIAADSNIPYLSDFFSQIGEVRLYPGREITPDKLKNADILIVRTLTKVNRDLLAGTGVRFVGSATIGYDHVDTAYLKDKGIWFAHAAGSNANSVSEYVLCALFTISENFNFKLEGKILGVIGIGNVGSRVVEKAKIVGMKVLQNDPPLYDSSGDERFVPLNRVLEEADIITVHVPLAYNGKYPTHHLCGAEFFRNLGKKCFFINTSRGPVVDSDALLSALKTGNPEQAALDVWENEPGIDETLLNEVLIGTPHIAGYSKDGKLNATRMIFESACGFFRLGSKPVRINLPPPGNPVIKVLGRRRDDEEIIGEAVKTAYNIVEDSLKLKKISAVPRDEKPEYFDALRNEYPVRREFSSMKIIISGNDGCASKLSKLGFKTEST